MFRFDNLAPADYSLFTVPGAATGDLAPGFVLSRISSGQHVHLAPNDSRHVQLTVGEQ
jgi:hypothetical protein